MRSFTIILFVACFMSVLSCATVGMPPIMPSRIPFDATRYQPNASPGLELYGTFHSMGVIVTLPPNTDRHRRMIARVAYRTEQDDRFQEGFVLSRVAKDRFVGSLFNLAPGTSYEVMVAFDAPKLPSWDLTYITATSVTRSEVNIPQPREVLIISPDGSGSVCSKAMPCNLRTALSKTSAGSELQLRGGVYYEGEFNVPDSGTAEHPIVIRSYEGETAVLDGSDPAPFQWTGVGKGTYRTLLNTQAPHIVQYKEQRLFPYSSLNALENKSASTPGFYTDENTLYVNLGNDPTPDLAQITISRFGYSFYIEQDFVYFIDLTFRYYGQGSYPKVIYLHNANNNLIQGCTFSSNDLGVGIKGNSSRNVIQDCLFHDSIFGWSWDAVRSHGRVEDGGVFFYDPVNGRGNIIRRNTFYDDFDGFGACPVSSTALTNETDVYENLVYKMGDDGMETDGRCSNVRIWDNTFHDVLMGISLAPVTTGPVYCIRNLIYRTGAGKNNYTGSPFKFHSSNLVSGPIFLFHNTASAVLGGNYGFSIRTPGAWQLIYARNNIWVGTDYAIHNVNDFEPADLDYDNVWNGGGFDLVLWYFSYPTLSSFAKDTGQEVNGFSFDPRFRDATAGDFSLSSGSPLIDKGVVIPGINYQFAGDGPDLGAFEHAPD